MAVARQNVLSSPHAQTFLDGAVALSRRQTGITPAQLNASGIVQQAPSARLYGTAAELDRQLSWWDLFTWWHVAAMSWPAVGNRAHRGPVFLPWHRLFLRRLEEAIQTVSGKPDFGLPYWDWAEDGERRPADQLKAPVWGLIGPPQRTATLGGKVGELRVRLYDNSRDGRIYVGPPRKIWREADGTLGLPTREEEKATVKDDVYDAPPWNEDSARFRSKAEGFEAPLARPSAVRAWMHNRVHVWIGGEMAPGSSPNDPAFWLNHCNIDRIWEGWMTKHGRTYLPRAGEGPPGQRADDQLFAIAWETMTPNQLLDPGGKLDWYGYDVLPD